MTKEHAKYRTLSVTEGAYQTVMALRDELVAKGLNALPADLRAPAELGGLTLSAVVEIAALAVGVALKGKGAR